ncbi:MAG TPA: type IX secretion system sortase PorU [Cyclobacteriaceae bacterium]|nr:type IX secretion system sortase PorU [Cyclobacteriaceae bacterium]HRK52965.1 type IX secretion system sortase PorU [Cyclobacteriaceae bacterium]
MKARKLTILIGLALLALVTNAKAQSLGSPLKSGQWARFSVLEDGVYKIDYNLLKSAGFDPDRIDPRNISLFGNGSGMLPQANSSPRSNHLQEMAITVVGESDGKFNSGDYILFYGQNSDKHFFDVNKEIFHYENHLYTDKNYYFLTISSHPGKRIENKENIAGSHPVVNTFNDFFFHEKENYNDLNSGRKWFGEQFDITNSLSLPFTIEGIVANSQVKVVSSVMGQSFNPASFSLSLNGTQVMEQPIPSIANTQYGIKGRIVTDTVSVNTTTAPTQTFNYQYTKGVSGKSIGYLDFLLANFERNLSLYGNQTQFTSAASLANSISTFEVTSFSSNGFIWDVTDPLGCSNQQFQLNDNKATFSTETNELKTFIAFMGNNFLTPTYEKQVTNQDLVNKSGIQLLIVTHPDFKSEAERLANHRQNVNGITSLVVTIEEIYNDYSGGKQDPTAIRDFTRKLYGTGLKNILLFGRSSFDYKDRISKNTNFVPTYESRNSLSPLETYSSDDYFAFMEINEGNWQESPVEAHTLDIGVGRLPVKTAEEAAIVVDKLIAYDTNPKSFGGWRKDILFVADDGDFNLHQSDTDKLAKDIEANHFQFDTKKIYLDAFKQISKPSGQVSPDARSALLKSLKKGVLIVNFTGHGSERVWLQEQILDEELIEEWSNKKVFPLLVTATCEFGRHDDPTQISSSELALTKKDGGAIGLVTAARPVNASTNAFLNKAFYEALFTKVDGKHRDLGAVFRETKNKSMNGVSNRNFSLLGDPSMLLAMPNDEIVATRISTATGSDTLKALSRIIIEGEIQTQGIKNVGFNGVVTVTLKDKEFDFNTLGDENPVFTYQERSNTLFRGEATVSNGAFQLEFILPKNIAYQVGYGKLSMYAKNNTNNSDAIGGAINFKIGESEIDDGSDTTSPEIKLYMGDTTFINGGITSSSTQLVARLSDTSGINIANYGIGNNLIAILDDDQVFEVGEYYLADQDDFTKGTIIFPIENLEPGRHTIELKAWDVYNNPSSGRVDFVVTDGTQIAIQKLYNYPNPFSNNTTIQFEHNRAGDDLEVFATIVDTSGQTIHIINYEVPSSQYLVTLPEWDGTNTSGTKLGNGLYLLRLVVRSLLDGSKNEQFSKLIILN